MSFLEDPIGSVLGYLGQQDTNSANAQIAQKQMDFQERMSNSAYQRQVADMQSAGLNPMLAYMKGGGASSPVGATSTYTSPIQGALQGASTSASTAKTRAEIPKVEAETSNIQKVSDRIDQEISNMKTDQQKTLAVIDNLRVERENLIKSGLNLTEVGNQLRASIDNLQSHSRFFNSLTQTQYFQSMLVDTEQQLKKLDLGAAKDLGNIGREYNQIKPIIDLLRSFIRR